MTNKGKIGILATAAIMLAAAFLFVNLGSNWDYALPRRGWKLLAIALTGGAIALSTVVFQTITHNRILTPSILGLDSLYLLIQTAVIFLFGSGTATMMSKNLNFLLAAGGMVLFAGAFYKLLFKREGQTIYFLLLVGLILGALFESLSSFMEMLIDPNEFQILEDKMFANFSRINMNLLLIAGILLAAVTAYFLRFTKYLDALSLGREQAINLGIDYDYVVKRLLIVIAILVSIPTALVGPITFLGLLVVNVAHQFLRTYRHDYLIAASVLISIIALVGGQLLVERVFAFSTTISVMINFVGGVYFIYLLLREHKAW